MRDPGGHVLGVIYIVHFDRKLHHAQHYIGWTTNLDVRLTVHDHGQGSRLLAAVRDAGIGFQVVRRFSGTRNDERRVKNQKNGPRWCPVCSNHPAKLTWSTRRAQ